MSISFRMEMVEDSSVFFRKVIPCLVQINLKLLAFLNFRHSLKRSLFNLVRLSLMKIFSVWSRSLLRLLKIRSLTLIIRKENASKERNCIISMFLTSFSVYFVFGYACIMCICRKTATWLFWDMVWLFLVKTCWHPGGGQVNIFQCYRRTW